MSQAHCVCLRVCVCFNFKPKVVFFCFRCSRKKQKLKWILDLFIYFLKANDPLIEEKQLFHF